MNKNRENLQETLNKFKGKKLTNVKVDDNWINFTFDNKSLLGIMDITPETHKLDEIRKILNE